VMSDLAKQFQADLDAGYGQQPPDADSGVMQKVGAKSRQPSLIGSGIAEAAAPDPERQEQRSSVKVSVNAKGDRQWEVKSYDDDLERAFARAVEVDKSLQALYGLPGGKS
jgi:hypothetical protein